MRVKKSDLTRIINEEVGRVLGETALDTGLFSALGVESWAEVGKLEDTIAKQVATKAKVLAYHVVRDVWNKRTGRSANGALHVLNGMFVKAEEDMLGGEPMEMVP